MDRPARFRALFAESYAPLRRWAHHRGITGADADDVVAEVFTIAWRRFDDIPADAAVPWLYGVARNVVRNHRRGAARRAALALVVPPAPHAAAPDEPADPDASTLRRALDALGDDDREILRLVAWDGLEPSQAAIALGCSASTARVRLFRARKRFAISLDAVTRADAQTRSERERSRSLNGRRSTTQWPSSEQEDKRMSEVLTRSEVGHVVERRPLKEVPDVR